MSCCGLLAYIRIFISGHRITGFQINYGVISKIFELVAVTLGAVDLYCVAVSISSVNILNVLDDDVVKLVSNNDSVRF